MGARGNGGRGRGGRIHTRCTDTGTGTCANSGTLHPLARLHVGDDGALQRMGVGDGGVAASVECREGGHLASTHGGDQGPLQVGTLLAHQQGLVVALLTGGSTHSIVLQFKSHETPTNKAVCGGARAVQ